MPSPSKSLFNPRSIYEDNTASVVGVSPNKHTGIPSSPSKLRTMMAGNGRYHKRNASDGQFLSSYHDNLQENEGPGQMLPPDHPHFANTVGQNILCEKAGKHASQYGPNDTAVPKSSTSPIKQKDIKGQKEGTGGRGLHKRLKSSRSLKSLLKGENSNKQDEHDMKRVSSAEEERVSRISGFLGKSKPRERSRPPPKDQQKYMSPEYTPLEVKHPIWEQFATQPLKDSHGNVKSPSAVNAKGKNILENEAEEHMPTNRESSSKRNDAENMERMLVRKAETKRPQTWYAEERPGSGPTNDNPKRRTRPPSPDGGREQRVSQYSSHFSRRGQDEKYTNEPPREDPKATKRGSKVVAAMAVFDGKTKATEKNVKEWKAIDVDQALEDLLVRYTDPK